MKNFPEIEDDGDKSWLIQKSDRLTVITSHLVSMSHDHAMV